VFVSRNATLTLACYTLRFAMPNEQLQLDARDGAAPGLRVVALTGVLTISTLFAFQDFAHADESEALILDLSGVPYIDSAGLGSLISAYVSREREARKMALASVSDRVKMVMTVSGVDQLFQTYADVSEAEKALSAAAKP
jgi:anti-sigma B factor antagonist